MNKFTKEEKIILLFLLATFIAGFGVSYYKKINPQKEEVFEFSPEERPAEKININKATADDLKKLKNIGPVLAVRIIRYRQKNGPFTSKEDIKNVKGIGNKIYDGIKDQIVTE